MTKTRKPVPTKETLVLDLQHIIDALATQLKAIEEAGDLLPLVRTLNTGIKKAAVDLESFGAEFNTVAGRERVRPRYRPNVRPATPAQAAEWEARIRNPSNRIG